MMEERWSIVVRLSFLCDETEERERDRQNKQEIAAYMNNSSQTRY